MPPAAPVDPTTNSLPESSLSTVFSPERTDLENNRRFWDLRGVQWRTDLGILPSSSSSSVDDLRRVTANSRRSYAALRRQLLLDPLIPKDGSNFPDLVMDNPLSQDPDSMWGRFFQKAELEKMVDQDLSRLYPEHGSYFQTPGCQGMLRRILLLWCIRHPNYGYRQGMHELLAPLLYVLQADIERLSEVRTSHEQYFTDNFDDLSFNETDSAYKSNLKKIPQDIKNDNEIQENQPHVNNLNELDPKIQTIISFSDAYGAEGELGILLSEKFIEHDAYCMFDALMNGSNGAVAMANFFSPSPQNGLPPVIEASSALYHLLSVVDSSLYTHLIELGVEPQYFALRWLRVLFGREFTLEDLLVIWDHIFSFDNNKLNGVSENDPEYGFAVLHSSRGAFISALAVSMILYIRSSILATETATSCLQRLLNFPEDVNLGKLLKKANSLVPLAIASIRLVPVHSGGAHERSKSSGSPVSLVRDTYWEEKWCDVHKEEEKKQVSPQSQNRRKGWSEKVKLRLTRTESDPSSSKAYREKAGPSRSKVLGPARPHVRRNLLDDLAQQLGLEEETEKSAGENGGSEENSSIFSDPPSPNGGDNGNDHEIDTERSSVGSNLSIDENDPGPDPELCSTITIHERSSVGSNLSIDGNDPESCSTSTPQEVVSPLPVSDAPENTPLKVGQNEDLTGKPGLNLKLLSGKFQWFWKFGKNGGEALEATKSSVFGCDNKSEAASSGTDLSSKEESVNENTISLKNVGQSMLENIQVIECVLEQEKVATGHADNLSKKALVDRGQMTAMAALKELRKISNLLSEM